MSKNILILLLVTIQFTLLAQHRVAVEIFENSELSISGSTNVIPFRLTQKVTTFTGRNKIFTVNTLGNKVKLTENNISIPICNFESDNKMALRDFKKLIREDNFPFIQLTVNQIEASALKENSKQIAATANIQLTITGKTKSYLLSFESQHKNNHLELKGKKRISIRDFGLEPPVTMMGLIKVSEWIDIQFSTNCIIKKI
jgi:hypothetical protein